MKQLFATFGLVVLVFVATGVMSAQSDPRIGAWKLDAAKSRFDAASWKSETRTYQSSGRKVMAHIETISSGGLPAWTLPPHPDSPLPASIPYGIAILRNRMSAFEKSIPELNKGAAVTAF